MASEIQFRTAIAAVNDNSRLRVYFQDPHARIRETQYEGSWKGGQVGDTIAFAKHGTPLAACTDKLRETHVFYLSSLNFLRQRSYNPAWAWGNGDIGYYNVQAAPYSKLAAVYLTDKVPEETIHLFVQNTNDEIQEWKWTSSGGWTAGDILGKALPGSTIAATKWEDNIRVYIQEDNQNIVQKCYRSDKGWWDMNQVIVSKVPIQAGFDVTCFYWDVSKGINLRLYWANSDGSFWQWCWDAPGKTYAGKMAGSTILGTEIAAIAWSNVPELRVYYQGGTNVAGITEWLYGKVNNSSVGATGKNPLPPA
ncbi:hypothetical protein ASPWEDRAFT_42938 [Aspergillus wentii DTO 134E9]|uniref:Fucose-specific lectin n=1 Tax=Aspergillus wentii DTO 134E9 TaxID=1073089 RepID=A0A1L9RDB2_ASPWE|nr:uncharacterized protein ASPWEDRAFT_42938 [Aspergillus wentii DTO 134E9]OJJ32902.1 hypothetical protein ASPWEDRAFT_42938 [Aspergillus wentii DTO 134E9]